MSEQTKENKILQARAKKLAHVGTSIETDEHTLQLVVFTLHSERYGIEAVYIREVYPLKEHSFVPGVPSFVFGLINIRRRIVSVMDLRQLFHMPIKATDDRTKAIILHHGETEFGVLAEDVIGLKTVRLNELQDGLPTLNGVHAEFLKGITTDRLLVLDAEKLLHSPHVVVEQYIDT